MHEKPAVPIILMPRDTVYEQSSDGQLMIPIPHGIGLNGDDVQEVVVVTAVSAEDVLSEEALDVGASFQSAAEIAAVEEVCGEQKNRLEMMLAAVEEHKQTSPKKLNFAKSRRGRQRRRWSIKIPSKTCKRHYFDSESSDLRDDLPYNEYAEKESYGRLMRREAKKRMFAHRYVCTHEF